MPVDFGKTASDYAKHRAGFPDRFFDRLFKDGIVRERERVLDLGTGTGTIARGLAKRGCVVTGLDPSLAMLDQAKALDREAGIATRYVQARAEDTGLPDASFDVVTAGTCWHWFDTQKTALEARRVLAPSGRLVIAQLDWLPRPGNVVEATERLIKAHNPPWDGDDGTGIYPSRFADLSRAGFADIESFSFDVSLPYSHEGWLGRIRASTGVGASLWSNGTRASAARVPDEPLLVPHRVFAVFGRALLKHDLKFFGADKRDSKVPDDFCGFRLLHPDAHTFASLDGKSPTIGQVHRDRPPTERCSLNFGDVVALDLEAVNSRSSVSSALHTSCKSRIQPLAGLDREPLHHDLRSFGDRRTFCSQVPHNATEA